MERDTNRRVGRRRREGPRASDQRHRALLEAIPDLILHIDAEGRFLDHAPAKGQPLLIPPGEFLGRTVSEVLPAELAPRVMQRIERALQTGGTQVLEYTIPVPLPDGNPRDYEARIAASGKDEVVAIVRDVTRSRRAREALRDSDERLHTLLMTAPIMMGAVDREGVFTATEGAAVGLLPFSAEEHIGRSVFDLYADMPGVCNAVRRALAGEALSRTADLGPFTVEVHIRPIRDADGTITGAVAVATNVTERAQAEKALSESEERLRGLVTNAPVIMFAVDSEGVFTAAEGKAMSLVGPSREEHIGRSVFEMYRDLPGVIDAARRALAGEAFTTIVELQTLTFEAHVTPIWDEDGKIKGAVAVATDITDRARAEKALRESEERFRRLAEDSIDGILLVEADEVRFVNAALVKMLGYERKEEIVGRPFTDFVSPEHREMMLARGQARREGREVPSRYEFRALRKDRSVFDTEIAVSTITYQGRQARQGVMRDITERARAEKALSESEERFRKLAEDSIDGILLAEADEVQFANAALVKMLGYERQEEIVGRLFTDFVSPEHREMTLARAQARREGREVPSRYELRALRKDGSEFDAETSVSILTYRGSQARLGVIRDITERKRAEEALRASEQRYRLLAENLTDVIWTADLKLNLTYVSPSISRLSGYTAEDSMRLAFEDVLTPASLESIKRVYAEEMAIESSGPKDPHRSRTLKLEVYRKDGSVIWVEATLAYLRDPDDRAIGVLGIARDVTERKRAHEALRQSEAKFRKLADSAAAAVFIYRGTRPLFVNTATEELTGYTREEILANELWQFVHPNFQALVRERSRARQQGEEAPSRYEFKIVRKSGEERWVDFTGAMIEFEGEPAAIGTAYDITERKRAEVALRESEERFRILSEATHEGIGIHEGGLILDANPQAAAMFGYEVAEFIGKDAFSLLAPESHDLVRQHIASGHEEPYEVTFLRKDGTILLAEVCGKGALFQGRPVRVSIMRDISERKRAEEALRRARDELETRAELGMARARRYRLTFRELTVLYLVAGGMADKEIAFRLGISHRTASKHLENILSKMGAMSRTEAGVRAIQEELVESLK